MKQAKQGGVILLTTMMMIVIVTLLVLSLMQSVFIYIKSSHQLLTNHQVFRQMEGLTKTMNLADSACLVQDKNPNQLVAMVSMNQGCSIVDGTRQYRYVVDDLGVFPCLQLIVDKALHGSHHWLVTLASMQPPYLVLQLRFAKPEDDLKCASDPSHRIHSGVISWRKINVLLDRNRIRDKIFD